MKNRVWNSDTKQFLREAAALSLPLAMQFLLTSTVSMADVVMIGRIGDAEIAAAGIVNQYLFFLTITSFGIFSGASAFLTQYWGAGDVPSIRRTIGMMYTLGVVVGIVFVVLSYQIPYTIVGIFSDDPKVLDLGVEYMRIVAVSFLPYIASLAMAIACRSTGHVRIPLFTSIVSLVTNIIGNGLLIFGLLGFPALGLRGAAIATTIARSLECLLLFILVYRYQLPAAAGITELFRFDRPFIKRYFAITTPVLVNEIAWSLGTSLYLVIYGKLGTSVLAAVQIANTVSQFFSVLARGAANASGIMVGNKIGRGDRDGAIADSRRFLALMPLVGLFICVLLLALIEPILSIYQVTQETLDAARLMLVFQALLLIVRAVNSLIIVGVCRCGGDTTFACVLDILPVWVIAIPLGFFGVHAGWPLIAIVFCICCDELVKPIFGIARILSNKWLRSIA